MKHFLVMAFLAFGAHSGRAQGVGDYQRQAIAKYPALGQSGSSFHTKFMTLYSEAKAQKSALLNDPAWPSKLADQTAQALASGSADAPPVPKRRAFDNIDFGDSKKVVQQKLRQSTKLKPLIKDSILFDKGYIDGEYLLDVGEDSYRVYFDFIDDRLFELSFHSRSRNASFYETLVKRAWESARQIAVTRFGEPTKSTGYPKFFEMKNGYSIRSDVWDLEDKQVRLAVGDHDSTYYATLELTDKELAAKQKSRDASKKTEAQKAAAAGF